MYFSCGVSYILPIGIVLFTVIPLLTLLFDWPIMPIAGDIRTLMFLLVPYLFATRLVIYVMYWNVESPTMSRNRDFQQFLWMAPYLCVALFKFLSSGIMPAKFKVTNASKNRNSCLANFSSLFLCWFHILYLALGVAAIVYRGLQWQPNDCVNTFQYYSQVLYVLLNMQSMMAPVVYVLFDEKEVDRKSRLSYNKYGVPVIDMEKVRPRPSKLTVFLEFIPALWGIMYLVIAIGFLFNYNFGCRLYFTGTLSDWLYHTRFDS
jgi:hypothetical protein